MAKVQFGNTVFQNVTGYRFAMSLQGGGVLSASFQAIMETHSPAPPRQAAPQPIFQAGGAMPAVGNANAIIAGLPLVGALTNGLTMNGFVVSNIDSRVFGSATYTLIAWKSPPAGNVWDVTPTVPAPAQFNPNHGGLVRLDTMGAFKPIDDTDSSGKVFSWRTERSNASDPIPWMQGEAGGLWTAQPAFQWYPTQQAPPQLQLLPPNGNGMLFEELYGRFTDRKRFRARTLEQCFANAPGRSVADLLRCDLDDIVTLPVAGEAIPGPYNPAGSFEERVSIVYGADVNFPTW